MIENGGVPLGTRVLRHESDAGRWKLALRDPDARLLGDVIVLEDYEERVAKPVRQRHLPAPFVPLIVNFGPPYRLADPADPDASAAYGSFTGGLSEVGAVTESSGTALCVQVNLTPLGARRVLGVPMTELAERIVPLEDVLGTAATRLEERLAGTRDASDRLALVESFLFERVADATPTRPDVAYAWQRLAETGGSLRIGALAAELGCSRKHLTSHFREQVGLGPKAAARLLRFDRALSLVRRGLDGSDIAHRCDYADQAHFVTEFRRFTGTTPSAFARDRQVQFLQDAAEPVA